MKCDIETKISTQDSDYNEKHKNHKFSEKFNKKPFSSLILSLIICFNKVTTQ